MRNKILKKEYLALGAVLLVFFCMALYKLTDTPLWYDEMIEFYYSKYLTGPIRGVSLCGSLYRSCRHSIHYCQQCRTYNAYHKQAEYHILE